MRNRPVIVMALLTTTCTIAGAQPTPPPERSPATAALLGAVVPGSGHLYAGEKLRAAGFFLAAVGNLGAAVYFNNHDACDLFSCDEAGVADARHLAVALYAVAGAATWIGSFVDAPRAVRRERERQRARSAMLNRIDWRFVVRPAEGATPALRIGVRGAF